MADGRPERGPARSGRGRGRPASAWASVLGGTLLVVLAVVPGLATGQPLTELLTGDLRLVAITGLIVLIRGLWMLIHVRKPGKQLPG